MQNEYKIDFQKERDFSGLLNATFAFLKQDFKPLFGALLKRTFPLIILVGLVSGYNSYNGATNVDLNNPFASLFSPLFFSTIFLAFIISVLIQSTVQGYIKHYVEKSEEPLGSYLNAELKSKAIPLIGISLLYGIIVFFGFLLLIIPGVWATVTFSLATTVIIFEGEGSYLSRSSTLIKNYFWQTFGAMVIIVIVYQLLTTIFSIPLLVGQFSAIFTALDSNSISDRSLTLDIVTNIIAAFGYLSATILYVFYSFHYFNLRERKESTGLMDKISDLEG